MRNIAGRRTAMPVLLGILFITGCTDQNIVTNPSVFTDLHPELRQATAEPYLIGVGDEIEVKFFFTPELNDLLQVRPDGKVSIMFAQDVQAAGKTPEELASILHQKLAPYVKHPDLVVVMRTFGSQKVFVGGEVNKPGPVQLQGNENLMQILDEAGWITPAARQEEIVLVRRNADGQEGVYPLDLTKLVSGQDMTENVLIKAGDLVLVPPSDSVSADRWIDQNIRQILPFSTAVYYDTSNGFAK